MISSFGASIHCERQPYTYLHETVFLLKTNMWYEMYNAKKNSVLTTTNSLPSSGY